MANKIEWYNPNDPTTWDSDCMAVSFKYNIEEWCREGNNISLFKSACAGDDEVLDKLPHWIAVGVNKIRSFVK